jgi:hypothetical protein
MTQGFYNNLTGTLQYAPHSVCGPDFNLFRDNHEIHDYPVYGWWWFDSLDEACAQLGVTPEERAAFETNTPLPNDAARIFKAAISEGFDTGAGFKLALGDADRNAFTQMLVLVTTAMGIGVITQDTPQTIADVDGKPHAITTTEFIGLMLRYGQHYKVLWDSYKNATAE